MESAIARQEKLRTRDNGKIAIWDLDIVGTLHIAIIEQINPDIFVSGDQRQLAVATARGFMVARF